MKERKRVGEMEDPDRNHGLIVCVGVCVCAHVARHFTVYWNGCLLVGSDAL